MKFLNNISSTKLNHTISLFTVGFILVFSLPIFAKDNAFNDSIETAIIETQKLDIPQRVKQQLINSISLKTSIEQFTSSNSGTVIKTVGDDNFCDFNMGINRIQNALDSNATEIRIATNFGYLENLLIADESIIIRGGYANCTDAVNGVQTGRTVIEGLSGAELPVIKIAGSSNRHTVILDSLVLEYGSGVIGSFPGGGISTILADLQLELNNLLIRFNDGVYGGGIAIFAGDTDVIANDTYIYSNSASNSGGGIYCTGDETSIVLHGDSGISSNSSTKGGGLFLSNGCQFLSYSGTATESDDLDDLRGIKANHASIFGGGIYMQEFSLATLYGHQFEGFGDDTNPASLVGNSSSSENTSGTNGGGANVSGAGTALFIFAGFVEGNITGGYGGAIYLRDNAFFSTNRISTECWSQTTCNKYANNKAIGFSQGGFLYNDSSEAIISGATIENNRAKTGTAISSLNASTTIKSSIIHRNGNNGADGFDDNYVIYLFTQNSADNAMINIHQTTIADNNAQISVFGAWGTDNLSSIITSSIIHDPITGLINDNSSNVSFPNINCIISHENFTIPSSAVIADPLFIDRANGNYHIDPNNSPAIDFCANNNSVSLDIDHQSFGYDDPNIMNISGPFDAGADETYGSDVIFRDGFEE